MNRKGFTLIEVLGVIVIISVLTALVYPKLTNSVKESSGKTDAVTEDIIYSAAKLYVSNNESEYPKEQGNNYCITLNELIKDNYLKDSITLSNKDITNSKVVSVAYNNGFKYNIVDSGKCTVKKTIYHVLEDGRTLWNRLGNTSTSIEFYIEGNLPPGYTKAILDSLEHCDCSYNKDNSIILYKDGTKRFIYSEDKISLNRDSSYLFYNMTKLKTIDISTIDLSQLADASHMFDRTTNLETIYVPKSWDVSKFKSDDILLNSGVTYYTKR